MRASTITVPVAQFVQQLKQKYPQYASVPNDKLVAAFLSKNPTYRANYQDAALVSISFDPAHAGTATKKPEVTSSIQSQPVTSSEMPYFGSTVVVSAPAVPARPMVGKYEIVDELGRGAMGVVYKAFDPGIGRTVALKVMSDQLARDAEFRNRFLREARGAGILQHPNIVTVYELGEWQGAPFIAMEFLEGRSLENLLKNGKTTPLEKRLDIMAQVCRGLDYAHPRGVVHRDIKPANVVVTNHGVAKIVDFGIARLADQKLTHTGNVLGTVSYMSPEQLQGKVLDGRSDIFAVGVMLFEALTSVLPFAAEDTGSAVTNILYRQPPSLSNFLANYPAELDDVLKKCLAKEPGERFQTAGELADRLSQVQQELRRAQTAPTIIRSTPLPADPAGFPLPTPPVLPQLALPKRRSKIIIAVAIALLVLVSSVGLRMLHTGAKPELARKDSVLSPQSTSDSEQSVRDAVSMWVDAFRSKDANRLAASYAPVVEKYFLKKNWSRRQVLGNIEAAFASMSDIRRYEVDDVRIEMLPTDKLSDAGRAQATFHKTWETAQVDGKIFSGEEIEKLTFSSSSEGWKIVREEELNIIRATKAVLPATLVTLDGLALTDPALFQYSRSCPLTQEWSVDFAGNGSPYRVEQRHCSNQQLSAFDLPKSNWTDRQAGYSFLLVLKPSLNELVHGELEEGEFTSVEPITLQKREYVAVNGMMWGSSGDHYWCLLAQETTGRFACWQEQKGDLSNYLRTILQPDEHAKLVGSSIAGRDGRVFMESYVEAPGDANCCPSRGKIQVELTPRDGVLYWSKVTRTAGSTEPIKKLAGDKPSTTRPVNPAPSSAELDQAIKVSCAAYHLDPDLLPIVLTVGTEFNVPATSPQRAAQHLRELLERYNFDLVKALAAYKAGPELVDQYGGVPPEKETRTFVARVVHDYNEKKRSQTSQLPCLSSLAILRNGHNICHEHRLVMGNTTRLYLAEDDSSFTDVPTAEITGYKDPKHP